jgi:hypothetical protein
MGDMRKITVNLPAKLLDSATDLSGKGVTEALREALAEYQSRLAWDRLASRVGKIDFGATYEELAGKDEEEKDWWR